MINVVGLVAKYGEAKAVELAGWLVPWLEQKGKQVLVEPGFGQAGGRACDKKEMAKKANLIIVLGGDGTLLSIARFVERPDVPIVGVNLGGLGFITEIAAEELESVLDKTLAGNLSVEKRMTLQLRVYSKNGKPKDFRVLNDGVITKGARSKIIDLETYVGKEYLCTYRADGLIICTPTGSTAYSLAAGGPILYPSLGAIVLSPICPHTLTNRPIVVSSKSTIRVTLRSAGDTVILSPDGEQGVLLNNGDLVEVRDYGVPVSLVKAPSRGYFEILRNRLKWGER
ncbi:MAG: NAD(+)/NADH kinase [Candidatus Binatia bacterium]